MQPQDDTGSLERARAALYSPNATAPRREEQYEKKEHTLPHVWEQKDISSMPRPHQGERHVRLASIFFGIAVSFFFVALAIAGYFFYFGTNSVGVDKISIEVLGPTTITGGDTVPLSLTITNKNPVAINNVMVEVDFPDGTRNAINVLAPYPRYNEDLGTLASGATVVRQIKAIVFGAAGQTLTLPVSLTYGTASSNAVFEKKSSYDLAISSTPLSVSVDSLTETVSGAPITFTATVRSNATIPLSNVVLTAASPFGFSITSSSVKQNDSSFLIGTLSPGASKQVAITGILTGQNNEQRVFHFTVGTAKSAKDQTLAIPYMTQDTTVSIAAPFITTTLALNGDMSANSVITPGSLQNVSLSYANTLATTVTNASIVIMVTGGAIDYDSIKTTSGFYNSADHTIIFSKDTDPALASLAPGASGIGAFTFSTLPVGILSPTVTLAITVSGTRIGQTNVPEVVTTSAVKTAKVATMVGFTASTVHLSGPLTNTGPIPPTPNQATTYSVIWNAQNKGNTVAGGTVTATLPGYVSYTNVTAGAGTFSYNDVSHTLTWNTGDLAQGASAQGVFQISLTPSTSQKGNAVPLTGVASFMGYDRFAGVNVSAEADSPTTETPQDPGYVPGNGIVQ